jgi:two-component system, NarL family, invasion response regulator UvrY
MICYVVPDFAPILCSRAALLRILIADDHVVVRKGVKEILSETDTPATIGEAGDGIDALDQALGGDWDVMLLDITMPIISGMEVLRRVKRSRPQLPVIMFSMHAEPHYIRGALVGGAAGYLTKESAPDELLLAIQTVLRGEQYLSEPARRALDDTLNSAQAPPAF